MKSYIKYILTIGLFSVIIAGASAQPLQSAYFLERAPLRHQLNPALIPERGYFTIPGLGNISFNVSSDLNYTTFIYLPQLGRLCRGIRQKDTEQQCAQR